MSQHYILDGHNVVPCDLMTWARAFETTNRRVAKDIIGEKCISTVFLGLDHSFGDGPPLLFETMVFKGDSSEDEICERCSTWEEAEAQHARIVELVKGQNT